MLSATEEQQRQQRRRPRGGISQCIPKKDKIAAVFSYLGWVFWIVAFVIRNKDDALSRRHLNQGFVLAIAHIMIGVLAHSHGIIGLAAGILGFGVVLLSIQGIISALRGSSSPLPVIGEIQLL